LATLTFAVVSAEPSTAGALEVFCRQLGQFASLELRPEVLSSYEELHQGTIDGRFHVIWAPPLVAIEVEDEGAAQSVVVVHRSTRAGYYSALFARNDSPFENVEALRGARVAWVSRESASGYFVPRWHLRSLGVSLDSAFSSEVVLGTHEAVTRAVLEGAVDVGATHVGLDPVSGQLASAPWLALAPAATVRVLLLVGPIPGDVIAISRRVDAAARRRLVAAMVSMRHDESSRALFEATQLDPVPDGHLDLLRRLAKFSETRA
jgi:ABC-type phosphate/phosphonate transport system substrate-binding protein